MDPDIHTLLQQTSTATLTTQLQKRKIRSCFLRGVGPLTSSTARLVGPAYTLRYIPYREDQDPLERLSSSDNPARLSIEECPAGSVLVVDAREVADCGTLGDILAHRLKVRGVAGFVSDGGIRDVVAVAQTGLPIYCAGAAAPASANAHIPVETEVPIACGGVAVFPGDIIVADADGVVVVPQSLAGEIAQPAADQEVIEEFIARLVSQGRPIIGTYPPTDEIRELYQEWITAGRPTS